MHSLSTAKCQRCKKRCLNAVYFADTRRGSLALAEKRKVNNLALLENKYNKYNTINHQSFKIQDVETVTVLHASSLNVSLCCIRAAQQQIQDLTLCLKSRQYV